MGIMLGGPSKSTKIMTNATLPDKGGETEPKAPKSARRRRGFNRQKAKPPALPHHGFLETSHRIGLLGRTSKWSDPASAMKEHDKPVHKPGFFTLCFGVFLP